MVQVKKDEMQSRIIDAAHALFLERGYSGTSLNAIAGRAKISTGNIYVYFPSRQAIFYRIYGPWLTDRLQRLENELAGIAEAEDRLRHVFDFLWKAMPAADAGFASNLMQVMSTGGADDPELKEVLIQAREAITRMITNCLPPDRRHLFRSHALAHVYFMAANGFIVADPTESDLADIDELIELTCEMILGHPPGWAEGSTVSTATDC